VCSHLKGGAGHLQPATVVVLHEETDPLDITSVFQDLKVIWDRYNGELNSESFRGTFAKQMGDKLGPDFQDRITYLFKKMDTNHDAVVDWHEFCTYVSLSRVDFPRCNSYTRCGWMGGWIDGYGSGWGEKAREESAVGIIHSLNTRAWLRC
jgi:hypothetical protein